MSIIDNASGNIGIFVCLKVFDSNTYCDIISIVIRSTWIECLL